MMSMMMKNVTLRNNRRPNYLKRKKNQLAEIYSVSVLQENHRIPRIKQVLQKRGNQQHCNQKRMHEGKPTFSMKLKKVHFMCKQMTCLLTT
ncbi:hypothetical protein LOK49_LG13G02043 [Camellia lanceoleosa]|uniref:Uncharacterized protein n=1 Tax=Camellia lanceoleosa TaxID=1840588 RepID=A0ACC0FLU8_9ERIC|nr:hypothetical protein LOK49_LG13G02043 [Camellia lanceoleosa]